MHRNDRDLLARMPLSPWEGWFCICIPRKGGSVRWIKTHLFRHRKLPGLHPVSAFEGLHSKGELVTYVATADAVRSFETPLVPKDVASDARGFSVALSNEFSLSGAHPNYTLRRKRPDLSLKVEIQARERLQWARFPGILSYFGLHSDISGSITPTGGTSEMFSGLGVLEHAWGGVIPINPQRLIAGTWHWDVLSFEEERGRPLEGGGAAAVLSIPAPGRGPRGVRSLGRLPGGSFGKLPPVKIEYLEFAEAAENGGPAVRYPCRWVGRMGDVLEYEARTTTPLARAVQDGGFFGFEFSARHRSRGERELAGSGFCEAGSPRWRL